MASDAMTTIKYHAQSHTLFVCLDQATYAIDLAWDCETAASPRTEEKSRVIDHKTALRLARAASAKWAEKLLLLTKTERQATIAVATGQLESRNSVYGIPYWIQ